MKQQIEMRRRQATARRKRRLEKNQQQTEKRPDPNTGSRAKIEHLLAQLPRAARARAERILERVERNLEAPQEPLKPTGDIERDLDPRLLDLIERQEELGLWLVPSIGKQPALGYKERFERGRRFTLADFRRVWRRRKCDSVLIQTHFSGLVVLDADNALSVVVVFKILSDLGVDLSRVLVVATRKGAHFYLLRPSRELVPLIRSIVDAFNQARRKGDRVVVDVRADRNGVVAAPWCRHSKAPSVVYEPLVWPWSELTLAELETFDPAWLGADAARRLTTDGAPPEPRTEDERRQRAEEDRAVAAIPMDERLRRAREWCAAHPPIQKGNRDNALFVAACTLHRGYALDDDLVLELRHELNQRCCEPPLEDHVVDAKLASARRSAKGAFGTRLLERTDDAHHSAHVSGNRKIDPRVRTTVGQRFRALRELVARRGRLLGACDCEECQQNLALSPIRRRADELCETHQREAQHLSRVSRIAACSLARMTPSTNDLVADLTTDRPSTHNACEGLVCGLCTWRRAKKWCDLFIDRYGDLSYTVVTIETPDNQAPASCDSADEVYARLKREAGVPYLAVVGCNRVVGLYPLEHERKIANRLRMRAAEGIDMRVLTCEEAAQLILDTYISWSLPAVAAVRANEVDRLIDLDILQRERFRVFRGSVQKRRDHDAFCEIPTMSEVREAILNEQGSPDRQCYEIVSVADNELLGSTPPVPRWKASQLAFAWLAMHVSSKRAREREGPPSEWYRNAVGLEHNRLQFRKARMKAARPLIEQLKPVHGSAAYKIVLGEDQLE